MDAKNLTVVIPSRNRPTLKAAVASALPQLRPGDRVCVVDDAAAEPIDGLTDSKAVDIVRLPSRSGVSAARNAGVAAAETPLIAFLDDDDTYAPDALEDLRGVFERPGAPCALVFGRRAHVNLDGDVIAEDLYAPLDVAGSSADARERLTLAKAASSCGWMMPRHAFNEVGGFDEALQVSEDRDLMYRLMQTDTRLVGIDAVCVNYMRNEASLSSTIDPTPKLNSEQRLIAKHESWFRQHPELAAMHLNRVASKQRKLGDLQAARDTLRLLCEIQPSNLRAWRRRISW